MHECVGVWCVSVWCVGVMCVSVMCVSVMCASVRCVGVCMRRGRETKCKKTATSWFAQLAIALRFLPPSVFSKEFAEMNFFVIFLPEKKFTPNVLLIIDPSLLFKISPAKQFLIHFKI